MLTVLQSTYAAECTDPVRDRSARSPLKSAVSTPGWHRAPRRQPGHQAAQSLQLRLIPVTADCAALVESAVALRSSASVP
jgi:hypothetical protein